MDAAIGERQATSAGPLGELDFGDYYHQLRTPQVALEARFWEMYGQMAVAFSLVAELFEPQQVDAAFAGLVELIGELADGPGWERVVDLPGVPEPEPGDDGLSLGGTAAVGTEEEAGPLRDDLEQRIALSWEEILDAPVLDRATPFFELGGDSLRAVRALARLAKAEGVAVQVRRFLDAPTVAGLAAAVREVGAGR
jgi:acyl carrier protein